MVEAEVARILIISPADTPIRDADFLAECRTYTITPSGRHEAQEDTYDDRVITYGIAVCVAKMYPQTTESDRPLQPVPVNTIDLSECGPESESWELDDDEEEEWDDE